MLFHNYGKSTIKLMQIITAVIKIVLSLVQVIKKLNINMKMIAEISTSTHVSHSSFISRLTVQLL